MKTKQLLGVTGSIIILLGVFAPLASVSIIGEMNYVQNNKGDGTIVLLLGIGSLALVLVKEFQWLWLTSVGCLAIMFFTSININSKAPSDHILHAELTGKKSSVDIVTLSNYKGSLKDYICDPKSGFVELDRGKEGEVVNSFTNYFCEKFGLSEEAREILGKEGGSVLNEYKAAAGISRTILKGDMFTKVYGDLPQLSESTKIETRIAAILAWKAAAIERATRYSPAESEDFKIQLDSVANRLIREEVYRGKITGVSLVDMAIQSVHLFGSYFVQWLLLIGGASLLLASAVIREKRVQSCTDEQVLPSETA